MNVLVESINKRNITYLTTGYLGGSDPENNITADYMKNSRIDGGVVNKSACRFKEAVYTSLLK